jgi:hypothetical protein
LQDGIVTGLRACGRDRASAEDAAKVPASCTRLERDVAAAASAAPGSAPAVRQAVGAAAERSAKEGFSTSMITTLWIVVGMLGLTFLVAFLLPAQARPEGDQENDGAEAVPANA